jgi:hypothetical protein
MSDNVILQVKTMDVTGPEGPTVAMMIAADIGDPASAASFVTTVAERFKLERMLAPPETSMLLVTLIGDLSADAFADRWSEIQAEDVALAAFMGMLQRADVMQGGPSGQPLSQVSLLHRA